MTMSSCDVSNAVDARRHQAINAEPYTQVSIVCANKPQTFIPISVTIYSCNVSNAVDALGQKAINAEPRSQVNDAAATCCLTSSLTSCIDSKIHNAAQRGTVSRVRSSLDSLHTFFMPLAILYFSVA